MNHIDSLHVVESINPRNGEKIGEYRLTAPSEISGIIEKSRLAFIAWSSLTLKARVEILKKAYHEFYDKSDDFALLISQETGKPLAEAYSSEILPVLDCFKYYIKNINRFLKAVKIKAINPLFKLRNGFVEYEPLGVVVIISPWNFPLLLSMQHIIPALLCGNVVIHKPSEFTTLTGFKISELFNNVSLPENVFSITAGFADVGARLVNSKIDKIFFTGSTTVGKKIYASAANNLVPVNMELGGSDPMIIFEDANLPRSINAAVWGAFSNTGQACVSVERIFVHESIFDYFLQEFISKTKKLTYSHKNIIEGEIACLINEPQFKKIEQLVKIAVANGIILQLGGKAQKDTGKLYFEPTVLVAKNSNASVPQEEIFGPVVIVTPFNAEEEAIELANQTEFGLSASIWTSNIKRGIQIAKRIQAGAVLINELQSHLAQFEAPYTGYKNSGLGVNHGHWGIMEMVRPKYISSDKKINLALKYLFRPLYNNNLWWFPYNEMLIKTLKTFIIFLHGKTIFDRIKVIPFSLKALFRKDYI